MLVVAVVIIRHIVALDHIKKRCVVDICAQFTSAAVDVEIVIQVIRDELRIPSMM